MFGELSAGRDAGGPGVSAAGGSFVRSMVSFYVDTKSVISSIYPFQNCNRAFGTKRLGITVVQDIVWRDLTRRIVLMKEQVLIGVF